MSKRPLSHPASADRRSV